MTDGIVTQPLVDWRSVSALMVRVREGGNVHQQHLYVSGADRREVSVSTAVLAEATRDTRGGKADPAFLRETLPQALGESNLSTEGAEIRVPWAGRVRGKPAHLVTIRPEGGGVLAFAWHGGQNGWRSDLRLLLPAEGAARRPLAWRLRAEDGDDRTRDVVVVAPEGAAYAELVTVAGTSRVELGADGSGQGSVGPDEAATVRAYDGDGRLLGETPVPPFEVSWEGVPGDTRGTRIVP